MFALSKLAFIALLAIGHVHAVGVRFHSLKGCNVSPIDVGCSNLARNTCCTSKGLNAGSLTFKGAKGRTLISYGGKGHRGCSHRVLTVRGKGKNTCVVPNGSGIKFHGASFKNPLKKRELDEPCEATQEPDVAYINGDEAVLDIASMTEANMSDMYELADNGTAVASWPNSLTQYVIDDRGDE